MRAPGFAVLVIVSYVGVLLSVAADNEPATWVFLIAEFLSCGAALYSMHREY